MGRGVILMVSLAALLLGLGFWIVPAFVSLNDELKLSQINKNRAYIRCAEQGYPSILERGTQWFCYNHKTGAVEPMEAP